MTVLEISETLSRRLQQQQQQSVTNDDGFGDFETAGA